MTAQGEFPLPPAIAVTWGIANPLTPAGAVATGVLYEVVPSGDNLNAGTNELRVPSEPYVPRPPYQRYDLLTISFPIVVLANTAIGQPPAQLAMVRIIAEIYGRDVWNQRQNIPLTVGVDGQHSVGYDIVQTDFVNPLQIFDSHAVRFRYEISFDHPVTQWDLGTGLVFADVTAITANLSPGQIAFQEADTKGFR